MTTKEYLEQIEKLQLLIENKLIEVKQLKIMACNVSAVKNSDINVQSSHEMDRLGQSIAKIVDMENSVNESMEVFINRKQTIIKQIESMEDTRMYRILSARYINFESWDRVAKITSYSPVQVKRIHEKALAEFEKMYGKTYLSENKI